MTFPLKLEPLRAYRIKLIECFVYISRLKMVPTICCVSVKPVCRSSQYGMLMMNTHSGVVDATKITLRVTRVARRDVVLSLSFIVQLDCLAMFEIKFLLANSLCMMSVSATIKMPAGTRPYTRRSIQGNINLKKYWYALFVCLKALHTCVVFLYTDPWLDFSKSLRLDVI